MNSYTQSAATVVVLLLLSSCAPSISSEARADAQSVDSPVVVYNSYTTFANTAGGRDYVLELFNIGDRTIKYVLLDVELFNAVGDPEPGEIKNDSEAYLRVTGPLRPNELTSGRFENLYYSLSGECIEIHAIEIVYANNSMQRIVGDDVDRTFTVPERNDCSVDL